MSLIADALKAAQGERSRQAGDGREAMARRILGHEPAGVAVGRDTIGWSTAHRRVPRQVRIGAAVFALALAALGGVVISAPSAERAPAAPHPAPVRTAHAPPATAPAAVDGADVEPRASEPGPEPARPGAGVGATGAPAPTVARAAPAPEPAPAAPPGIAEREPAPAEPPAEAAAPAAGRFELRVEGTARPAQGTFADAVAAHRRRDYAAAVELYRRVVRDDPDHAEALNNLGSAHQALGQLAEARDAFRRALALDPRYPAAWSNLGVVLTALGETTEAQAALAEAVRLDPNNHGARVNLALLFQERGLTEDAHRLLQEVVAARPALAEGQYALARLLEGQGDLPGALRHYRLFLTASGGRLSQVEALVRQRIQTLEGAGAR